MSDQTFNCPHNKQGYCHAPDDIDINDLNAAHQYGCQGTADCNHYQSLIASDIGCSSIYVGDEDDDPI